MIDFLTIFAINVLINWFSRYGVALWLVLVAVILKFFLCLFVEDVGKLGLLVSLGLNHIMKVKFE